VEIPSKKLFFSLKFLFLKFLEDLPGVVIFRQNTDFKEKN